MVYESKPLPDFMFEIRIQVFAVLLQPPLPPVRDDQAHKKSLHLLIMLKVSILIVFYHLLQNNMEEQLLD